MDNKASFNIPTTTTITTTTTSTTTNTPQANSPSNEPIIFVIPGGGGKTTLCTNTKYLDIDQFWDINAIHEKDMISRWEEAKRVNNQEVVNEIIEECVLYKAKKCKDNIIKYEKPVVLVQSVGQARIITTNMENVYCLVPDKSLHESNMQVRGDPEWIKEICRKQRDDIIGSGLAIKYYMKMEDLSNLALECLNYRDESYMQCSVFGIFMYQIREQYRLDQAFDPEKKEREGKKNDFAREVNAVLKRSYTLSFYYKGAQSCKHQPDYPILYGPFMFDINTNTRSLKLVLFKAFDAQVLLGRLLGKTSLNYNKFNLETCIRS